MKVEHFKGLSELPQFFFDAKAEDLIACMETLSLFQFGSKRSRPIFVSVMLHGNEHSGWYALQELLKEFREKELELPRSMLVLVGNVEGAPKNQRVLDSNKDLNRLWRNQETGYPEDRINQIIAHVESAAPILCVDIHNTSGRNIHYACVPDLAAEHLQLARLFSRVIVYVKKPDTTLMSRMSALSPSVTLECGRSCEASGIDEAKNFIHDCLKLSYLPHHNPPEQDVLLLETLASITIPENLKICFKGDEEEELADIVLRNDLDSLNFSEVHAGEILGTYKDNHALILNFAEESKHDEFLSYRGGKIILAKDTVFAMLSMDKNVIHQDCLGYLMQVVPSS